MLEIRHATIVKTAEERELIRDLSFVMNKGDKFALIGLEGSGKSTLLKWIVGDSLDYVDCTGEVVTKRHRIGYLPQSIAGEYDDINVLDFLLKPTPDSEITAESYRKLTHLNKMLQYVHFDEQIFDETKTIRKYSGGELVKLGLVKLLLDEPDVLVLDEPTNDLDLDTILFMEDFIQMETRPILYISHDEALLEATATGIIHLVQTHKRQRAVTFFVKTTYMEYKQKRKDMLDSQEMIARKQRSDFRKKMERFRSIYQTVEHQQNQAVRNPSLGRLLAKKMKSIKSTEHRYQREQEQFLDIPEREESIDLTFTSNASFPNNKDVIRFHEEELVVGGKVLARNLDMIVKGPQKIAIIGKNGSGKTTLLKVIRDRLIDRDDIRLGYMPQAYEELLTEEMSALDIILPKGDRREEATIRKMMGALQFTREEMEYKQTLLSGGQKAKLFLLKMVVEDDNVLLLDEPTRNLSPLSIPVIHQMLLQYQGAIIAVTHDRNFIENVFDKIYVLDATGLHEL